MERETETERASRPAPLEKEFHVRKNWRPHDETLSCPRRGCGSESGGRLLLDALRRAAERAQERLRKMDARRSVRELRYLGPRRRAGTRAPRYPGRFRRRPSAYRGQSQRRRPQRLRAKRRGLLLCARRQGLGLRSERHLVGNVSYLRRDNRVRPRRSAANRRRSQGRRTRSLLRADLLRR